MRPPRRPGRALVYPALLALLLGCGGTTNAPGTSSGATEHDAGTLEHDAGTIGTKAFPSGTYTRCVEGQHAPTGNTLNAAGFQSGAALTVTQSGDTLTAKYVDQNGLSQSFTFAQTTSLTGALAPTAQTASGFTADCVYGPGDNAFIPAALQASAGSMTYSGGAVFLTLAGTVDVGPSTCRPGQPTPPTPGTFWVTCEDRAGGLAAAATPVAPEPTPQLPVGLYACDTQLEASATIQGIHEFVTGGRTGTLTLKQSGAKVIAEYAGDSALTGTMHLTVTTPTTASADASQSLTAPCMVPIAAVSGPGPSPTPATLPLTAGALSIDGTTLLLSFAGAMDASSSCPGALMAGNVICSKM